mgnify:CR=1 FL=1
MSNPFKGKAESTASSKMTKTTGSSKNYKSQEAKADRRYAGGGDVNKKCGGKVK